MSDELKIAIVSLFAAILIGIPGFVLAVLQLKDRKNNKIETRTETDSSKNTHRQISSKRQLLIAGICFIFNFFATYNLIIQVWNKDEPITRLTIFWIGLSFSVIIISFLLPIVLRIYDYLDLQE